MVEAQQQGRHRYTRGRCGRCGAYELHRSHSRTLFERVIAASTPLIPVRCPACGYRALSLPTAVEPRIEVSSPAGNQAPESRRRSRRTRRLKRRLELAAWVVGGGATVALLGYLASRG